MSKIKKAKNWKISQKFLNFRKPKNPEFKIQKWITFSEKILEMGLDIYLYEAQKTASKYIAIHYKNKIYRVRFSDHKPIKQREEKMDCDFFVGVNNNSVKNTEDALIAVKAWKEKIDSKIEKIPHKKLSKNEQKPIFNELIKKLLKFLNIS